RDRVRDHQPAGARLPLHRAGRRALRGDGRRRERAGQRPRRQRREAEEADEHARRRRGRDRPPHPAAATLARAGARVHSRRRGGRGDTAVDPAAEGRALGLEAGDARLAREAGTAELTGTAEAIGMPSPRRSATTSLVASPDASAGSDSHRSWRGVLDAYTEPRIGRSVLDLATSVVPYLALLVAMAFALRVSVWLSLLLVVPASAFLVRTFIVFHDCTHGSFMRSRRANDMLGVALGLLVWLPYRGWQHEHAVHHATAGDLDRRGVGDVATLTVAEYRARPAWRQITYRLYRSPVVMFGLGWFLVLLLKPRFVPHGARPRVRNSVLATNAALALIVTAACLTVGWRDYLLVQGPVFVVSGAVGVWLFYVQHQFEDTYWQEHADWRYDH